MRLPHETKSSRPTGRQLSFRCAPSNNHIRRVRSDESLNHGWKEVTMTERKQREIPHCKTSLGFVVMLLLSTLGVLAIAPASSANVTGSIGISGSTSPVPGAWHSSFDTIGFEADVTNYYASPSGAARTLTWYACEGNITSSICKSVYEETGQFNMGNIQGQSTRPFPQRTFGFRAKTPRASSPLFTVSTKTTKSPPTMYSASPST